MRKLTLSAVAMIVLTSACADQPTGPVGALTAPEIATATKAIDINEKVPITIPPAFAAEPIDNPCTTPVESITFAGTLHQVMKVWDNGRFRTHLRVAASGTDAAGNQYMVLNELNESGVLPATLVINFFVVSKGSAPNFVQRVMGHLRRDGQLVFQKGSARCVG